MAKQYPWINREGKVLLKASDSFTRSAEKTLRSLWPHGDIHHMRVGKYAVVMSPPLGLRKEASGFMREASDILLAPVYEGQADNDGSIAPGSKYWADHKADRMSQLGKMMGRITRDHPLYEDFMIEVERELKYYLGV